MPLRFLQLLPGVATQQEGLVVVKLFLLRFLSANVSVAEDVWVLVSRLGHPVTVEDLFRTNGQGDGGGSFLVTN